MTHYIYIGSHAGRLGIKDIVLCDMPFPDKGQRTQQLVVIITQVRQGIILVIRLDAYNVVGTLVAGNLRGGNVHHLDIFGHDNVRGHFPVDVNPPVGEYVAGKTEDADEK